MSKASPPPPQHKRLSRLLLELFGLSISEGALCNLLARARGVVQAGEPWDRSERNTLLKLHQHQALVCRQQQPAPRRLPESVQHSLAWQKFASRTLPRVHSRTPERLPKPAA